MACPYFHPVSPDPACTATHATRPLGDAWSGECHADPAHPWQPGAETLYPLCNIGYARSRCPRFPDGEGPDSIRFAIASKEGASDAGGVLLVWYAVERDHLPFAHGALEYSPAAADFVRIDCESRAPLEAVARLARAYVASYFRRRAEASGV